MFRKYLPFYKRLLQLAIPLVLTQAGQMIVQLVDNAMVGRVGTTELAAASFANSIYIMIMIIGLGIFLGITPLIGHALGAKDGNKVATIMKNGVVMSVILIALLTTVSWLLSYLMPYMNQTEAVWKMAIPYYRILTISLIPFLVFMLLKQIGEGVGNTLLAMIATIASNVLNVGLNYVLIFGKLGFPELGLVGAGYATLISRILMPILIYIGFKKVKGINQYFKLLPKESASWQGIKELFVVGLPIAGQMTIEVSLFTFGAIMMGWMGDIQLAAHQVAMGLASFTFMIANGVAMATTIRVSYQLGKKNFTNMGNVAFSAVHLVLIYMLFCGIGFYLLRFQLPKLFSPDPAVIIQTASLLTVAAIFQLFDGLQVICLGILRGIADVKAPMLIAGLSYLVIGLPTSYLCAFTFHMGPEGIWYGFVIGLATTGILLALRIRKKINRIEHS